MILYHCFYLLSTEHGKITCKNIETNKIMTLQWYPKRLDAITDALIYQSQFGGIYCNSFIPANFTVTTIITF